MADPAPFDPERLLKVLNGQGVKFVLIGALAARLQGFPRLTADADITPEKSLDNLERLATALRVLDAKVYTESVPEGLPFDCSAGSLARARIWNLVTSAGRLDIIFEPAGILGYQELHAAAVTFDVFGMTLKAAALEDILRSKQAADRPQDRQDVLLLRDILRRQK